MQLEVVLNPFRDTELAAQHIFECLQLMGGLFSCSTTGLTLLVTFDLTDENILPALVGDKTAIVHLPDDRGASGDHPDTMKADDLHSWYVVLALLDQITKSLLCLFAKNLLGLPTEF